MGKVTLTLPLYIELGVNKKHRYYINLNGYRNWHYRVSNQLKKAYKVVVGKTLVNLTKMDKVHMVYYIYYPTNRKFDLDNIGSVSAKFLQDALVEFGILEDDNYEFIQSVTFKLGGIDKDNPRVEVVIEEC